MTIEKIAYECTRCKSRQNAYQYSKKTFLTKRYWYTFCFSCKSDQTFSKMKKSTIVSTGRMDPWTGTSDSSESSIRDSSPSPFSNRRRCRVCGLTATSRQSQALGRFSRLAYLKESKFRLASYKGKCQGCRRVAPYHLITEQYYRHLQEEISSPDIEDYRPGTEVESRVNLTSVGTQTDSLDSLDSFES